MVKGLDTGALSLALLTGEDLVKALQSPRLQKDFCSRLTVAGDFTPPFDAKAPLARRIFIITPARKRCCGGGQSNPDFNRVQIYRKCDKKSASLHARLPIPRRTFVPSPSVRPGRGRPRAGPFEPWPARLMAFLRRATCCQPASRPTFPSRFSVFTQEQRTMADNPTPKPAAVEERRPASFALQRHDGTPDVSDHAVAGSPERQAREDRGHAFVRGQAAAAGWHPVAAEDGDTAEFRARNLRPFRPPAPRPVQFPCLRNKLHRPVSSPNRRS